MFKNFSRLSTFGKNYEEIDKILKFRSLIRPQQNMNGSTCLAAVREKTMEFIRVLAKGDTHDSDGRPLTFAELSSYVTEMERQWDEDQKRLKNVSQVSTSNSNNQSNSNSDSKPAAPAPTYNKESGESLHRFINAIDVGVLYRNVDKIEEEKETYKTLPNVTKQWFRNNPKREMPSKFKRMTKPVPNPKNAKNRKKKKQQE